MSKGSSTMIKVTGVSPKMKPSIKPPSLSKKPVVAETAPVEKIKIATPKKVVKKVVKTKTAKKPKAKVVKVKAEKTTKKPVAIKVPKEDKKEKAAKVEKKVKSKVKAKTTKKKEDIKTTEDTSVLDKIASAMQIGKKNPPPSQFKKNPLGHLLVEKMLREAGFRGGISSDTHVLDKYSTDESIFSVRPQVVIQPKNRQDVEIATKVIAAQTKRFDSLSLTPRAAGTGLSGGSLSESIIVDTVAHLNKIGEVVEKKDSLTFTCEPGAMWRDVEEKLKKHNAYIPSYTAAKDTCSIGGSIGNNVAGPDSLLHGRSSDWVEALDVVLSDGFTYTISRLTFREFKRISKEKHEYARMLRETLALIEQNEKDLNKDRPALNSTTAGYALWNVIPEGVEAFKKGKGTFNLTHLISGSQGTIGIITNIKMRALPIQQESTLLVVPIFDLQDFPAVITKAMEFSPSNIEFFDGLSFDLALKNPDFFKKRLTGLPYYRTMLNMYTTHHVRYRRKTPEFTLLISIDREKIEEVSLYEIILAISTPKTRARVVSNEFEAQMLWQIRRSSYSLAKLQSTDKRPAAFLEDISVPPKNLAKFLVEVKKILKEFNLTAITHGHGANGHFHFYPFLDFTQKTTPMLVEKLSERFHAAALKHGGGICGEHNDGIMCTPHLSKVFSKRMVDLFAKVENIFDPDDIFNPNKKISPTLEVKENIRTTN